MQAHTQATQMCLRHPGMTQLSPPDAAAQQNESQTWVWQQAAARHQPRLPCDHLANNSGLMFGPHTSCDTSWMDSDTSLGRSVIING